MVAPAVIGAWLDRRLGTAWLSAAGLTVGFATGLWLILKLPTPPVRRRADATARPTPPSRELGLSLPALPIGPLTCGERCSMPVPDRGIWALQDRASLWLVVSAAIAIAGLAMTRGFVAERAVVAFGATVPGALIGRFISTRRPKDAAQAVAIGLAGSFLRVVPPLVALGWLARPSMQREPPEDTATWLIVTYLAVLVTDIGLHIARRRRHTVVSEVAGIGPTTTRSPH